MSKYKSIAIDGPSSAGKSTLSRLIGSELGFIHVDTGALYRAVSYYMILCGIGPKDRDGIKRLLSEINIELTHAPDGEQRVILNGSDITSEIRTPQVTSHSSGISSILSVRTFLLDIQRDLALKSNVIMDGRDIGTVVLPDADIKIFLTASPEERANRRYKEYVEKKVKTTYEQVLADINKRDANDTSRAIAPLKPAADSILVDTTSISLEESAHRLSKIIREKLKL